MQQWQKAVVRQQKMLQKAVLSRFIPVEGDPRLHIRGLQAQEFRGLMNQLCVASGCRLFLVDSSCLCRYAVLVEVLQQCKHVHKLICGASEAHASAPVSNQVAEGDAQGTCGSGGSASAKKAAEAAANDSLNVLEKVACYPRAAAFHHGFTRSRSLKRPTISARIFSGCVRRARANCLCCSLLVFSTIASSLLAQRTGLRTSR